MLSHLRSNGQQAATSTYAQNSAADNPRLALILNAVAKLFFGSKDALTRPQRDMLEMLLGMVVEQGAIPGAYSGGKMFSDMMNAVQSSYPKKVDRQGVMPQDFNELVKMASIANNTREWVQDYTYTDEGTMNYSVTGGLSAKTTSQLSSRYLAQALKDTPEEKAYTTFEYTSVADLQDKLSSIQTKLPFERGGSTYKRLQRTADEMSALETYALEKSITDETKRGEIKTIKATLNDATKSEKEKQDARDKYDKLINEARQTANEKKNLKDVFRNVENDADLQTSIKQGSAIGIDNTTVSQESLNTFQELNRNDKVSETFVSEQVRDSTKKGVMASAENIKMLSQVFGTDDLRKLQEEADKLRLGSITDQSNIKNVRASIQESMAIANASGRDLKAVFEERAEITKALAPEAGGIEYVDPKTVTAIQQTNAIVEGQRGNSFTDIKTAEEYAAAHARSRSNTDNVFGGAAKLDYVLDDDDFKHLSDEAKKELSKQREAIRAAMARGDREEVAALSKGAENMITKFTGDDLSQAQVRKALRDYGGKYDEWSRNDGISQYIRNRVQDAGEENGISLTRDGRAGDNSKIAEGLIGIIRHTGYSESEINRITGGIDSYREATDKQKWEKDFISRAEDEGYTSEQINEQLQIVKDLSNQNVDAEKAGSFIKSALMGTDTIPTGYYNKNILWKEQYKQYSSKKDKNLGLTIPDMLIAGLYGDGSGQLTQDEVADMEYAEYLKSNGIKTTSRESMDNYFKSKDKLTGIALGKIDKQGNFVDDKGQNINKQIADDLQKRYSEGDAEVKKLFKEQLKLDSPEKIKNFLSSIEKYGYRGIQAQTQGNSDVTLDHSYGEAYLASTKDLQDMTVERNKDVQSLAKVDFSKYIKRDLGGKVLSKDQMEKTARQKGVEGINDTGVITKEEYGQILKDMYGTSTTSDLQALGVVDKEGKFTRGPLKGTFVEDKDNKKEEEGGDGGNSALDYLNKVDDKTGLTNASELARYQQNLSSSENPVVGITQSIANGVDGLNSKLTAIAGLIRDYVPKSPGGDPQPKPAPGSN